MLFVFYLGILDFYLVILPKTPFRSWRGSAHFLYRIYARKEASSDWLLGDTHAVHTAVRFNETPNCSSFRRFDKWGPLWANWCGSSKSLSTMFILYKPLSNHLAVHLNMFWKHNYSLQDPSTSSRAVPVFYPPQALSVFQVIGSLLRFLP